MDILSFILGFKKGIASGGGGGATVDPVHTVIFMSEDGTEVLYQRSVVDGDDCADVVARGLLATPTKESTPQYSYTYSGWSMTSGGAASSSALSAVTEDRTVYAAFTSALRYYTITYLDEDGSVLNTESLAYGAMPSYVPEKDGYDFVEWSPKEPVTGDMIYTASWKEKQGISYVATFDTSGSAACAAINNAGSLVVFGDNSNGATRIFNGIELEEGNQTSIEFDTGTSCYWWSCTFGKENSAFYVIGIYNNKAYGKKIGVSGTILSTFSPSISAKLATSPVNSIYGYSVSTGFTLSNGTSISITSISDVAISPDGNHVAIAGGSSSPGVFIYDIETGTLEKTVTTVSTNLLSYNNGGNMLAIALSAAPYVEVYDTTTWEKICDLSGIISSSCKIAMMGSDTLVVGSGTTVHVYTITSDGLTDFEYDKPTYSGGSISGIHKNPSGNHIVFRYSNGLEVWKKE